MLLYNLQNHILAGMYALSFILWATATMFSVEYFILMRFPHNSSNRLCHRGSVVCRDLKKAPLFAYAAVAQWTWTTSVVNSVPIQTIAANRTKEMGHMRLFNLHYIRITLDFKVGNSSMLLADAHNMWHLYEKWTCLCIGEGPSPIHRHAHF